MVQRWDPFSELRQMQENMDRMWRRVGANGRPASESAEIEAWGIPLDVTRQGDDIEIRASMPGVLPEDIQVSIEDNVLTVKGRTAERYQDNDRTYLMKERRTGAFYRALRLPDSVDPDKVEPQYEHGVLTIKVPKAEEKRARQLQVKVGSNPGIEGGSG